MIHSNINQGKPPKAVGLISGGLDSILAAKVVKDLGVDVHGVYFAMPWGCCDKAMAQEACERIGIKLIVLQLDERYLKMVKNPKYGYGKAMNPCVDCRIHMFSRAAQYMRHIGADFVFTGEVLGQRPMSQMRNSMRAIEKGAGLEGRLLRPLSAQLLDPTIPEAQGVISRDRLLKLNGRSRKPQMKLAEELDMTTYNQPAGGCLLTDKKFANRMRDTLNHGYRNFRETVALQWGRHFRINEAFKAIVGRDKEENAALVHFAHKDDIVMLLAEQEGPTVILKGEAPSEEILSMAAGLVQKFSKYKDGPDRAIKYWKIHDPNDIKRITARKIDQSRLDAMYL